MDIKYTVVRSDRKTFSIQVKNSKVILRVPKSLGDDEARSIIKKNEEWIRKQLNKCELEKEKLENLPPITQRELHSLGEKALVVLPRRVKHYAALLGVSYGKITVRNQRGRWGSCNSSGDLSFNCLLMLTPLEVIDSVVVHELCHRKEMNHSSAFYREVLSVYPEYHKWHGWLKRNGGLLIKRMMMG